MYVYIVCVCVCVCVCGSKKKLITKLENVVIDYVIAVYIVIFFVLFRLIMSVKLSRTFFSVFMWNVEFLIN
jgi:hypothetical protein